ncbi:NusG domain II-containing protein [candidate division WOR-3 bacterium]|nr:NusG domain II-containing protein [candidate division WOR-3 bacterium]
MQKMREKGRFHTLIKFLTPGDKILIVCLLLASVASGIALKSIHTKAKYCIISIDGKDVYELPLNEPKKVKVKGPLGYSIIEIDGGKVRMLHSPCPLKICMHQGFIKNPNETIICVPNKVMIRMTGKKEVDGITW